MKPGIPWSVKGIDGKAREVAKDAARAEGMTLGEWLNHKILESAQEDAELKSRATRTKASSSVSRRPGKRAPKAAARTAPEAASEAIAGTFEDKFDELFERIASLQASPATTTPAPAMQPQSSTSTIAMEKLLDRLESGERHTRENLDHLNDKVERIGGRVEELADRQPDIKARDLPGFSALEGAVRNIVDHIEKSETQTRETMNSLQSRLADISGKVEGAGADTASSGLVKDLEQRMAHLAQQVEKVSGSADDTQLKQIFEARIRELAERIDTVRHSAEAMGQKAQATASKAAEEQTRAIEQRLSTLVEQAEKKLSEAGTSDRGLSEIQTEIAQLHNRFEEIRQQAASDQEVQALRTALENLSSRVEDSPAQEPIAQIEQRIAELTQQLQQVSQTDLGPLEQRISALDSQLATAASQPAQPDAALAEQIGNLESRLSATEQQLGSLGTIENSIQQLFASLEQSQAETRQLISSATAGQGAGSADGSEPAESGELKALQDGLAAVRANAEAADQRTQETLEAVHETLAQIITKLAEIDTGGKAAATGQTGTDDLAATAAAAAAALGVQPAVGQAQQASGPEPETAAQAAQSADPSVDFSPFEDSSTAAAGMEFQPATPGAHAAADAPGTSFSAAGGDDWLSVVRAHMNQNHGGAPDIGGTGGADAAAGRVDFIAAARRAASSASPASPAGATLSATAGFSDLTPPEPDETQQSRLMSLLSRKSSKPSGKKGQPQPDQGSSRKRLVLAALVLLAAVSAYSVNSGMFAEQPVKQSSLEVPAATQPAQPVQSLASTQTSSPAAKVSLPANTPPVELPAASANGGAASLADPITTASVATAQSDPVLSQQPSPLGNPLDASPAQQASQSEQLPEQIGTQALRDAAMSGDSTAQFVVASRYLEGRTVGRDHQAAARWYTRAANGGLAAAQYRIGTLHERGSGVKQDRFEAMSWYAKAAAQGNVKAMHNLAVLAADSTNGKPDMARAAKWFAAAAAHGLPDSQFNYGVLNERGIGVTRNVSEAYKWFSLAARQGDKDAIKRLEALKGEIDPATREQIAKSVASWKPSPASREANMVSVTDPAWGIQQPRQTAAAAQPPAQRPMNAQPVQTLSAKDQVMLAQQLLAQKGFDPGPADGSMGSHTANAIRLYQLRNGLPVNGSVSRQLLQHLQAGTI
jgi:localization factor PodJL